ncbi:MAG TPA: serine hydrolase domain-containing protein [Bryobacteraceae bacterium]|jgi:CubicO group peptidase (beta-lactamase class C family)|nr:serine hydrolase domain-containing protein [Bryobacteraceae bacterium]
MRNSRRDFLCASIGLGTAALQAANSGPSTAELAAMDAVVDAFMVAHSVPGMSVAVARDGVPVHQKGYGFADREAREKVTPANLFRIASVSKPITSVAIFQLIEQGKLKLDDPVFGPGAILGVAYGAPPYQPHVAEIRLHHLLTHTGGGWQNDGTDPMFSNARMNQHELIAWTIAHLPLAHAPGEHYAYSNFGYCVVGRIVEKVTGKPYAQHVRDAVLARCGIDDMRISGNTRAERARGEVVYYPAPGEDAYDMDVRRMDSHGGWLATAPDLVRFATHLNMLRPTVIAEMMRGTTANAGYACGWAVNQVPNWWHNGSLPGTTSIMVRTASGFCWSALLNTREEKVNTGGALDRMMWEMVRKVASWRA